MGSEGAPATAKEQPAAAGAEEDAGDGKKWKVDMEYINHRTADPDRLESRRAAGEGDAAAPPSDRPGATPGVSEKDEDGKWKVSTSYIDHRTADPNNREVRRAGDQPESGLPGVGPVEGVAKERDEDGKWKPVSTSYINHRTADCENLDGRKLVKQAADELNPAAAAPSATVKKEEDGKWKVDTSYIGYRTGDTGNLDRKIETTSAEDFPDPAEKKYSYEELKGVANRPADVDPKIKEQYLSAEEFKVVFAMEREEFSKMPKWKQQNIKKEKDLF